MNSDIIVLEAENKWMKNLIWTVVSISMVVFILMGEQFFNLFTIIFLTIVVVVLFLFNFIMYRIKMKHDQYIKIEIENKSIIKYYEKNECLYTFNVSDIQSITYYFLLGKLRPVDFLLRNVDTVDSSLRNVEPVNSSLRNVEPVLSIDLKNKMNIYVSNLIDIEILFTLNDQIERENFVSHFMEELWNPIFSVRNQLKLLNNQI